MMATSKRDVVRLPHHVSMELCMTRAKYRQGKKLTAVKVYTVNSESQHLLVCGIPSLGLQDELRRLCARFGDVRSLVFIPKYAEEEFTEAYHVQYSRIQSARYAKHNLDGRSFYGGILHVCYAPEMESVAETRAKLIQRRKDIAIRTRGDAPCTMQSQSEGVFQPQKYGRRKKHPALPLTDDRVAEAQASGVSEASCIWQGVSCTVDPRIIAPASDLLEPTRVYGPQRPDDGWALAGVRERRTIAKCSNTKQTSAVTTMLPSVLLTSKETVSPVLRFIPRQVRTKSQIVFHNKVGDGKQVTEEDKTQSPKSASKHVESGDTSLNATVVEVRKKIRAVSVPNVQIIYNGEDPLAAK